MTHTAIAGKPADHAYRGKLLRLIHVGMRELGIDEPTKQAMLTRQFGQPGLSGLRTSQLVEFLDALKNQGFAPKPKAPARAGSRPMADGEMQRKIRALWLSLYHLGAVGDPREAAIAAFVKRQTRRDALQWIDGRDAARVVEALKAKATRAGVDWTLQFTGIAGETIQDDRYCVCVALWSELRRLGAVQHADTTLEHYAYAVTGRGAFHFYEAEHWSRLIEALGAARLRTVGARHG